MTDTLSPPARPRPPSSSHRAGALVAAHEADGHVTSTGLTNEKLGMWVFLGSECLLFGGLISTYLLYKNNNQAGGPIPHDLYDIPFTSISSFVLLMSSLTMVLAVTAAARGDGPQAAHLAAHHRPARQRVHLGPGLRVPDLREGGDGLHHQLGLLRRSTRSPASTACTSPSASSC